MLKSINCMQLCEVSLGHRWNQEVKQVDQKQGQSQWDADVRQTLFWQALWCERCGNTLRTQLPKHLQSGIKPYEQQSNHTGTPRIRQVDVK